MRHLCKDSKNKAIPFGELVAIRRLILHNQLATDALMQGFEETMWIDSDVAFSPDDVQQLRDHDLPITCGIYPKKGSGC